MRSQAWTERSGGGLRVAAIGGALVLLAALHLASPPAAAMRLTRSVETAACLAAAALCARTAVRTAGLARMFWGVLGAAGAFWLAGILVLPSAVPGADAAARIDSSYPFFGAATIAFVVACALRPDRPRSGGRVAFDVLVLVALLLHTFLYFVVPGALAEVRLPTRWLTLARDARLALVVACALWLVAGSRGSWRRIYLELAAAMVTLFGGSAVVFRFLGGNMVHPGLWAAPFVIPFAWIGVVAADCAHRGHAQSQPAAPDWADLRRGTAVALLAVIFVPALDFVSVLLVGGTAPGTSSLRAGISLATTVLVAALLLWRQIDVLGLAERAQRDRERALRESEERFSKAFSASPAAMSISTLAEGRYLDVNDAYLRLMARPREEVIGRTSLELGFFTEKDARERLVGELAAGRPVRGAPLAVRVASGERRDVLVSLERIDIAGTPCILGEIEDVTERLRASEALRASEQRYRLLFERNLAGVFRTTPEGAILECNDALVSMLGYADRAELLALRAEALYFDPADRRSELELLAEIGSLSSYETRLRRRDGSLAWVITNEVLVRDGEGGTLVVEGTVIDITHRKWAEEEVRRLDRLKTGFLMVAAHEMRTPLTVLAGYHDMLLEGAGMTAVQRRSLEVCHRMVDRLARTFRDIAGSLQIAEGRVALNPVPVDVRELARQVLEELAPFAEKRGQAMTLDAPGDGPPARLDRERIHEAIANLVENAIKFTPDGGRITVSVSCDGAGHRVAVRDTGVGIDAGELADIWERFYAGANPMHHTSGTYEFMARGSGLGLAIAKGYVEAHGGHVVAESEGKGRGSTFTIVLPAQADA